jgi:hypothetical protein
MDGVVQEIINEVKECGIQFIIHATSLLHVIASNVRSTCLSKVNEIMHPNMVFHHVNDGLSNLVHCMKGWHATIIKHANICRKKVHK